MHILFLEPYDGGSHRSFREGLISHSCHDFESLVLPARNWKWRMRGSAVRFADEINASGREYDLIFVSDYLNVADLRGLLKPPLDRTPLILYMHENQLTYPLSPDEEFDFHFGFTNIISQLAADRVIFNSQYHHDLFLAALPDYLARMPDGVPSGVRPRLEAKSTVLPVGLESRPLPEDYFPPYLGGECDRSVGPGWPRNGREPVILWNHRWEFDKRPDIFGDTMLKLAEAGFAFRLLLLGEIRQNENVFAKVRDSLGGRIDAWGYQPDRATYENLLQQADIVISCAEQEYFGISVAEALHAGAYAVLPTTQVYPSLYGSLCKGRHFYRDATDLEKLLTDLLGGSSAGHVCSLPVDCDTFCWDRLSHRYDAYFEEVIRDHGV